MKHRCPERPIGKCKGCCLNARTRCAASLEPREEWGHGKCRHFNDYALRDAIETAPRPTGAHLAKLQRRNRALQVAAGPHYNGMLIQRRLRQSLAVLSMQ
jgi:hypothetical protein